MFNLCETEIKKLEEFLRGEYEASREDLRQLKEACKRIMEKYDVKSEQWGTPESGGGSVKFFIANKRRKSYYEGYQYTVIVRREPGRQFIEVKKENSAQKDFGTKKQNNHNLGG